MGTAASPDSELDLFRRAAPLLSQKRKGGWNAEEKWSAVCFSWLSDAGENASLSDGPLAHKKKKTVQKQIERWKADERFADTMSLMVDTPPSERPSLIAQIRKVSTSEGRRALEQEANDEPNGAGDCSVDDAVLLARESEWLAQAPIRKRPTCDANPHKARPCYRRCRSPPNANTLRRAAFLFSQQLAVNHLCECVCVCVCDHPTALVSQSLLGVLSEW